jgi:hypothetical protein
MVSEYRYCNSLAITFFTEIFLSNDVSVHIPEGHLLLLFEIVRHLP